MRSFVVLALMAAGAAPGAAQVPEGRANAAPAEDKKVCRRMVETGSIMSRRVCHTRAEWAEIDRANAEGVDRAANARMQAGR